MKYSHNDINKNALYVLREDSGGKFSTDYLPIPIDKNLLKSIENLSDSIKEKTKI